MHGTDQGHLPAVAVSLLLLFQNIRTLLVSRSLGLHYIGSVNELDLTAGGNNQLYCIGSVNESDVL